MPFTVRNAALNGKVFIVTSAALPRDRPPVPQGA